MDSNDIEEATISKRRKSARERRAAESADAREDRLRRRRERSRERRADESANVRETRLRRRRSGRESGALLKLPSSESYGSQGVESESI